MNIERYVKKQQLYALIFIAIGIAAGITGFVFKYQKGLMTGITFGFLPTGVGTMIVYKFAKKKPELEKNIELENEERNLYINSKAGHTAFWATYWYLFAAVILYHVIHAFFLQFLITTICVMPVIYFLFVGIYHKKY